MGSRSIPEGPVASIIRLLVPTRGHNAVAAAATGQPPQDSDVTFDKKSLGPFADEKRMPKWLIRTLRKGDTIVDKEVLNEHGFKKVKRLRAVEYPGIVPVLVQLSKADDTVVRAVYCNPCVHYVARVRREGSFCGYRNIQMLITCITNAKLVGHQQFDQGDLPTIFTLQQMIEEAWKRGFNDTSQLDIGPLYMTRKFIGTSEAEALFLSLGVPVTTKSFVSTAALPACRLLAEFASKYFGLEATLHGKDKVAVTDRPPLYFQRPGHSQTVVGIEEDIRGRRMLIVMDPNNRPTSAMKEMAVGGGLSSNPGKQIKPYRCSGAQLARHDAFELVMLGGQTA